jgi:hypothetical protein
VLPILDVLEQARANRGVEALRAHSVQSGDVRHDVDPDRVTGIEVTHGDTLRAQRREHVSLDVRLHDGSEL